MEFTLSPFSKRKQRGNPEEEHRQRFDRLASIFRRNARTGHRDHYPPLHTFIGVVTYVKHLHAHGHLRRVVGVGMLPVDVAALMQALGHDDFLGTPAGIDVCPGRGQQARQISCQL